MSKGPERRNIEIRMNITDEEARELLRRLAEDDEFRGRVEQDAKAALLDYGIDLSDDAGAALRQLPPKDEILRFLKQIGERDVYGEGEHPSLGFGWWILSLGFAMPLVPADEEPDDAR
jgi:putative modified peptide